MLEHTCVPIFPIKVTTGVSRWWSSFLSPIKTFIIQQIEIIYMFVLSDPQTTLYYIANFDSQASSSLSPENMVQCNALEESRSPTVLSGTMKQFRRLLPQLIKSETHKTRLLQKQDEKSNIWRVQYELYCLWYLIQMEYLVLCLLASY